MGNNIATSGGNGSSSSQYQDQVSIFPELFTFYYSQGSSNMPPAQLLSVSTPTENNSHIEFEINYIGVTAGWITITPVTTAGYTHQIEVDPTGFNAGIYQANIRARLVDDATGDTLGLSDPVPVNLNVIAQDFINVTPAQLSFTHQLGQNLPPAQTVQVDSNINWTATANNNAIDISVTSGSAGSTIVSISLNSNAENLSAGTHNFQVVFANGSITDTLNLTIEISNATGFAISPNTLTFDWLRGSALPASQVLHLFSDDDWNIVSKPNWLFVTPDTGTTSATLTVLPANITNMSAGTYTGNIEFNYQGSTTHILVPVMLNIFDFLTTDLEPGKFYFTKDTHWLNFTSNRDNTYIEITLNMLINHCDGAWQPVERVYKLPLFQRKGNFHVGEVVHQFMDKISKDLSFPSLINITYQPAVVDIHIKEIDLTDASVYFQTNINSVRYVKAKWKGYVLNENQKKNR